MIRVHERFARMSIRFAMTRGRECECTRIRRGFAAIERNRKNCDHRHQYADPLKKTERELTPR